ncbi:MAG: hypothetical protein JW892_06905, partial [Anaerolineae bacterium]|nr:hypothetical protein [Anaerolineae bacterium]
MMGNVTAGMLKSLISIWRAGDADPKRLARFEDEIGPLVRTVRHYYNLSDSADVALDKWDEFFEVQIAALVEETDAAEGALGAALWHGVEFTMLNLGFEHKTDLSAYLREVRDREWPDWCARYHLPPDTPNLLYYSEPKIYEYMELGREALAERLNGPLFAFEQPGGSLQTALSKFSEAIRAWLDALPNVRLTEVYVAPRLLENDDVVADEDLIDWLSRGETVFVQANAGMGKSMFLRHFGLRLLDAGYLPLWIELGDEILAGEAALASYLTDFLRSINRFDIPAHWVGLIAEYAHQHRRIIALVEEGEKWNRRVTRRILKVLGDCARSVLVVGRTSQWPPASRQVAPAWDSDRLEQVMLRRGNARRFAQLEAWVREGRMLPRPWEYGIAAEIEGSEPFDSPVEMLEQALAEVTTERSRPGEARSYRSLLRAEAWREITDGENTWKTVGHNNKKSALWACEMRVMYESADDTFRFSHDLWRSFFAADHAIKQKYTPEEITVALVGVRDWEQTIAWIIDRAAHDSKRNEFAGALLEAVASELSRTWRGSGWLQGAQAVGAALRLLEGYESARRVRAQAEQALLALLPPTLDDEVVSRALLALAPLSQDAVGYLWHEIFARPWQSVQFVLLEEPGIARRLLSLDSPTGREDGVYLLWCIARSPNVDLAQLVTAGERWHAGNGDARRRRVSAISGALSIQGTDAAAWRLATWLEQEAQIDTDADFAYKLRKNLEEGLRLWSGSGRTLAKNMATLFRTEIPDWIWRPVLDAMLRDRDEARPILQARLDDPN